jgi:hypothetical protein
MERRPKRNERIVEIERGNTVSPCGEFAVEESGCGLVARQTAG